MPSKTKNPPRKYYEIVSEIMAANEAIWTERRRISEAQGRAAEEVERREKEIAALERDLANLRKEIEGR